MAPSPSVGWLDDDDAEPLGGAPDPPGDLAAVRDEQAADFAA